MDTFKNQLSNTIEYLDSIKYDSFASLYYVDLLQNLKFQQLIKSLLDNYANDGKEIIFTDSISKRWRIEDITYILAIWGKTPNTEPKAIDEDDETECDEFVELPIGEEVELTCSATHENITPPNAGRELFELSFCYEVHETIGCKAVSKGILRSNMFNLSALVPTINAELNNCLVEISSDEYHLSADHITDFYDYLTRKCTPPMFIDKRLVNKHATENEIILTGKPEELEEMFLFLRVYLSPLSEYVEIENIFSRVACALSNYNALTKSIRICRLFKDAELIKKIESSGVEKIGDFKTIVPHNLTVGEAKIVLETIQKVDTITPDILVKQLIDTLTPREKTVIIGRYLYKHTLEMVGTQFGLTRERVRQVENKAIRKLNHSTKKQTKRRLYDILKLHSYSELYITQEELLSLYLPSNTGLFLDKVLGIFHWDSELELGFFNEETRKKLFDELEELPPEFTYSDLDDYAGYVALEMKNIIAPEEVKFFITKRFKTIGDFIVKGRLKLKVVLSYLIKMYFPEGFDIYDDSNIEFLREKAKEHFDGFELADTDRAIRARLQYFCAPIARGVWKFDTNDILITGALKERILKFIEDYPVSILPIQAVLDTFKNELAEVDIENKYHLQGQLKKVLSDLYEVNRDYVIKGDSRSFYSIIEDYVKQSKTLVTKRDIMRKFPGVTEIVIQQTAAYTKVLNMNGYYVHLDNLNITQEEQAVLKNSIDSVIVDTSIYHAKTIFGKSRVANAGLFSRIGITHYLQFYYLIKELFPEEYSYNRPFVAMTGVEIISGEAQVLERIAAKKEVTIADVREFAKEVGTFIDRYIEFVNRNNDMLVFKNHTTLILVEETGMEDVDFSSLDSVLSTFISNMNYRPLNEFFDYWKLPDLKCKWNEWLLYSVIEKYSSLFKTAVSSNYLQEAVPILVQISFDEKDIDFSTIHEDYVSEETNEDDLLDSLDYDDLV